MATRQTEEKNTALYERLSRDDDVAGDSNSILNQKRYLESFAKHGWSGGNFERPGWKRLVADIEAGKVAHLLCKDLSRIGRNYLQTGFYTEIMFRQYGVHFIAVANNIDSDEQESSEFAPFLNIMNEWYLRDQSKKVAAAYRVKGKAGKPTSNSAIYGYKKDPEDKDHWLVDEEAAAVVRRIFRLAVEGHGPYEISKMLTAEKVECPGYYLAKQRAKQKKQGKKSGTSMLDKLDKNRPYDWYGNTVSTLLERPEYMGHTVNFRSSKKSYRDKRVRNAPEDWLIFENTHEAIVDPETWQLAQQVKRTMRRTDTTGVANPFTGLVFCADCGATGDVIDFVARLFGLSSYEAAKKLAYDFGIDPDKPPAAVALNKLCDYLHLLERWKVEYAPQSPEDELDDRFVEACQMMEYVNYLLDVFTFEELEQRVKAVDILLKDGGIAALEQRLKRLEKEVCHRDEERAIA